MYTAQAMAGYLPPLPTIRAFLEITAQGRFNRAAEALGLTESAVSHQLRKLEEGLGVRLLERKPDGIALTEAGLRFQEKAERAMWLLSDAVEEVRSVQFGKVSITLARALAAHWLVPRYASFYAVHPEIELQLLPTTRLCDLIRERIDLGIRYGDGVWPGLKATHLIEEVCFPVATPTLAREWRQTGWDGMEFDPKHASSSTAPTPTNGPFGARNLVGLGRTSGGAARSSHLISSSKPGSRAPAWLWGGVR
jgi:DNA-binding transcriptional LysR family regulator